MLALFAYFFSDNKLCSFGQPKSGLALWVLVTGSKQSKPTSLDSQCSFGAIRALPDSGFLDNGLFDCLQQAFAYGFFFLLEFCKDISQDIFCFINDFFFCLFPFPDFFHLVFKMPSEFLINDPGNIFCQRFSCFDAYLCSFKRFSCDIVSLEQGVNDLRSGGFCPQVLFLQFSDDGCWRIALWRLSLFLFI